MLFRSMLVAVSGTAVTAVGGVLQSCLALRSVPRVATLTFVSDFWSYVDSAFACVEGLTDGTLTMSPASGAFGAGPVTSADDSLFGVMEWDAPPIGLPGPTNALPLTVGLIPVNLEGGMQRSGPSLTTLYYR